MGHVEMQTQLARRQGMGSLGLLCSAHHIEALGVQKEVATRFWVTDMQQLEIIRLAMEVIAAMQAMEAMEDMEVMDIMAMGGAG
jgi:hypothetical protein